MASRVAGKIKLQSVDELLGVPEIAGTQEIEIERIHAFPNHPFKVLDDEKMDTLVDSIRENGILNPVIVRPDQSGNYEMISGHRRLHAAKIVGLKKVPAIVKEMSDDEAIIKMVDANIQREEILPSERAFSFKMKMEAMSRQGSRVDLTCGTEFHKSGDINKKTRETIGDEAGMTGRQVTKYIRLTEPDIRIQRVHKRAIERFGRRVLEGGDMYESHMKFLKDNRSYEEDGSPNMREQKEWMTNMSCVKIELDGATDLESNADIIVNNWSGIVE